MSNDNDLWPVHRKALKQAAIRTLKVLRALGPLSVTSPRYFSLKEINTSLSTFKVTANSMTSFLRAGLVELSELDGKSFYVLTSWGGAFLKVKGDIYAEALRRVAAGGK